MWYGERRDWEPARAGGAAVGYCGRTWMSGSGGCCWGRRRSGWAVAASRRWPGRPGRTRTRWRGGVREADGRPEPRVRAPGGGRKRLAETDPGLVPGADGAGGAGVAGNPESPLRWTCLSTRNLAGALTAAGHPGARRRRWRGC